MPVIDQAMRALARQFYGEGGPELPRREHLEEVLLPMIRCAMRTGRGAPPLVQWVRRNLPTVAAAAPAGGPGPDLEWAAPTMARLLSARLLGRGQPDPVSAADTVVD